MTNRHTSRIEASAPRPSRRLALFRRALTIAFLGLILGLLVYQAREVDWRGVAAALLAYPSSALWKAGALVACSYFVYSCFDLLARPTARYGVAPATVMTVTFVSHALGLTLGVAGVALRFRLYGAYGIDSRGVARIWGMSVLTNWLGFLLVAGVVFAARIVTAPAGWSLGAFALQTLGFAFLAAATLYLVLCAMSPRRSFTVFGTSIAIPDARIALMQFALSSVHWLLIAGVLHALLQDKVSFATVLGAFFVHALALAVADVPGGLGVTEAVFITILGSSVPLSDLLAALVAYRALFYLAPLLPAIAVYLAIELRQRTAGAPQA